MNTTSSEPFGLPDDAPDLARRFAAIMAGLGALVARRFVKMPHLAGITVLLWAWLNRAVRRFHRALTNPGPVRAARVRADRKVGTHAARLRLPSGRGWIVRELGWEAAGYLAQLEALLARAPNAGRVMRPICRMLGVSATLTPEVAPKVPEGAPIVHGVVSSEVEGGGPVEADPGIFSKSEKC